MRDIAKILPELTPEQMVIAWIQVRGKPLLRRHFGTMILGSEILFVLLLLLLAFDRI